jgi:hypothetical protein
MSAGFWFHKQNYAIGTQSDHATPITFRGYEYCDDGDCILLEIPGPVVRPGSAWLSRVVNIYHTGMYLDCADLATAVDILQTDGIKTVGTRP